MKKTLQEAYPNATINITKSEKLLSVEIIDGSIQVSMDFDRHDKMGKVVRYMIFAVELERVRQQLIYRIINDIL